MDERLDKVKVQCDYLPLINFAMQQNGASIIHQISIENTTHAPLKDVQVQITTEPTFGNSVPTVIEAIPADDRIIGMPSSLVCGVLLNIMEATIMVHLISGWLILAISV